MDSITVLRSPGRYATKQFSVGEDGKIAGRSYDDAKHFQVSEIAVGDLGTLASALETIARDPYATIIRGRPREGINRRHARRLLHEAEDKETGEIHEPTFEEAPRQWLLLDFDNVPGTPGCAATDGEMIGVWLRGKLPEPFRDCAFWWCFTSSALIKPGVRMRLAFWLSRPMWQWELDVWLAQHPVDRSVFRPVQVIYLATPVFSGLADPVPERHGLMDDWRATVEAPVIEPPRKPPPPPAWASDRRWKAMSAQARTPEGDLARAVSRFAGSPVGEPNDFGGIGRHHALFCSVMSVCGHIREGRLDKNRVEAEFLRAGGGLDRDVELRRHIANAFRTARI